MSVSAKSTFYADNISETEQNADAIVRIRIERRPLKDEEFEENSDASLTLRRSLPDENIRHLQESISSLLKENNSLRDQLSTIAELKAQGDSFEMQAIHDMMALVKLIASPSAVYSTDISYACSR